MKKILFANIIALTLLLAVNPHCFAQGASVTADDTKASLEISKNIIKLIGALAKDYTTMKGSLITKTDDGTSVFEVTNMEGMMADNQYIMIKSGGAA